MLAVCDEVPFGKQPVIERASGLIVGYVGVDWFDLDHERRLEIGWRLVPGYRGMGYATEAGQALLGQAADTFSGDIFAIIHRGNRPSLNVARKLVSPSASPSCPPGNRETSTASASTHPRPAESGPGEVSAGGIRPPSSGDPP
jgi:hypothetical protein